MFCSNRFNKKFLIGLLLLISLGSQVVWAGDDKPEPGQDPREWFAKLTESWEGVQAEDGHFQVAHGSRVAMEVLEDRGEQGVALLRVLGILKSIERESRHARATYKITLSDQSTKVIQPHRILSFRVDPSPVQTAHQEFLEKYGTYPDLNRYAEAQVGQCVAVFAVPQAGEAQVAVGRITEVETDQLKARTSFRFLRVFQNGSEVKFKSGIREVRNLNSCPSEAYTQGEEVLF